MRLNQMAGWSYDTSSPWVIVRSKNSEEQFVSFINVSEARETVRETLVSTVKECKTDPLFACYVRITNTASYSSVTPLSLPNCVVGGNQHLSLCKKIKPKHNWGDTASLLSHTPPFRDSVLFYSPGDWTRGVWHIKVHWQMCLESFCRYFAQLMLQTL